MIVKVLQNFFQGSNDYDGTRAFCFTLNLLPFARLESYGHVTWQRHLHGHFSCFEYRRWNRAGGMATRPLGRKIHRVAGHRHKNLLQGELTDKFGKLLYLLTFRFTDFQTDGSFVYFPHFDATGKPADTRIYGGTGID